MRFLFLKCDRIHDSIMGTEWAMRVILVLINQRENYFNEQKHLGGCISIPGDDEILRR